jgi:N-acetylglucosaminyldiphosphoundecaprenol N-acetyl-beta-D-mannosaminyltransferase
LQAADILGVRVDACTLEEAVERIASMVSSPGYHQVVTANAEMLWRSWHEPEFARILAGAALVTADGVGVLWAARRLGQPPLHQVTGIDLVPALARRGAEEGWRFFLYGAQPGVAEAAAERLAGAHPGLQVVGVAHGYQTPDGEEGVRRAIRLGRPHVLLVALGSPRQEYWIARYLDQLGVPVAVGVGGTLDVLAGRARRAPLWVRRRGLEWLYRLLREPGRWRRQAVLPAFAWRVFWAAALQGGRRTTGRRRTL